MHGSRLHQAWTYKQHTGELCGAQHSIHLPIRASTAAPPTLVQGMHAVAGGAEDDDVQEFLRKFCSQSPAIIDYQEMLSQCAVSDAL